MLRSTLFILMFLLRVCCMGQANNPAGPPYTPKVSDLKYKLGQTTLTIRTLQYGPNKDLFFINLHDDEMTAVAGATKLLKTHGGTLVRILNHRNRNIRFTLGKYDFVFDPNRIFSRSGIIQTLRTFGPINANAIAELERFAAFVLALLPASKAYVIALHNNSDGKYSITSYLKGNEREKDAKKIHLVNKQDPDDMFLTTDSALFRRLTREKFNTVLQDNARAYKDGSLSIYCGERNIAYLNCETEHGRLDQYTRMIATAVSHIRATTRSAESNDGFTLYRYELLANPAASPLQKDYAIYFGEKKIGTIKSLSGQDAQGPAKGKLEIIESFPIYDNMDFFYYASRNTDKIELRIDPTRSKKKLDPEKGMIVIRTIP
jgi:hypothetical protein